MTTLEVANEALTCGDERKKLLSACLEYRALLDKAELKIAQLTQELAEVRQALEDVAIGTQVECNVCGKYRPCDCDK